jgi:hypothetical protein
MTDQTQRQFGVQIIYQETVAPRDDTAKGLFANENQVVTRVANLDVNQFSANLEAFCKQIGSAFASIPTLVDSFELDSFELTLDVTAKGEVRFIGSVGTEIKGGLKIVFRRDGDRSPK